MKRKTTHNFLLVLLLLFSSSVSVFGQTTKVYANSVALENNTDFSNRAVDGDPNTAANVRASSGLALGAGAYSGYVEIQFDNPVPANTTSFVKIATEDNLLPALLGGSLGGLLSDVLGSVLIGNQEFTIQAKNGNAIIMQGQSQNIGDFATNRLRIVSDNSGNFFIAITPNASYNRIRLRNRVGSLVGLFNTKTLSVFEAFYITGTSTCGAGSFTAFNGQGLNLDLLNLGGAGVTNPQNVIDGNPNNFSQLSLGILGVAASIEQTVFFDSPTQTDEEFNIRLQVNPSLLAVGVANNIEIIASNNATVVETRALNSLLNLDLLTLLQNGQAVIPFKPNAPANRITVRYSSLLNVQLTQSLDLYEIVKVPIPPVVNDAATQNAQICSGNTASLIAEGTTGTEIRWYDAPVGGNLLQTVNSGATFTTDILTENTIFYAASAKVGCVEESRRIPVSVTVTDLPTAEDIQIGSNIVACSGNTTIFPTSSIGEATIKYYTDQNKTQEIVSGFSGIPGVTFVKNSDGSLTISGLTSGTSPLSIFIGWEINNCENAANDLAEVQVIFSEDLSVEALSTLSGCGSVNLRNAIHNFDPNLVYSYFDASNSPISPEVAANITASGNYFIEAQSADGNCVSEREVVAVTINEQPTLTLENTAIATQVGASVSLNATSNFPIIWYDQTGNALPSNVAGPFTTTGNYSFTAIASNGNCTATATIIVTVFDANACPPLFSKKFAVRQRWSSILTGGVANASNAVDGNLQSYSTIVTGIGLLGVGTTTQVAEWDETIAAGTPVTLKLGSEYSGLALAEGFFVVGTKRNASGIPVDIGVLQPVSGALLNLLPGQNTFELTFVPANASGPQAYDGVRLQITSLVSIAQNARFYEAYYQIPATQIACNGNDGEDVLFGAVDLGIGALTATVGVSNPLNAIDNSQASFATMFTGVGVLAAAELTAKFKTPSVLGDRVRIRISNPGSLLDLNLLSGISIQPLYNNAVVGTAVSSSLLNLELLPDGESGFISFVPNQIFNGVRIRLGGIANVLDALLIHDIAKTADVTVIGGDAENSITACQGETITLNATATDCTNFIWYDAITGGNIVATGNSYTIPASLPAGNYTYYIQPVRFGCELMPRGSVSVTVRETAPSSIIEEILLNGDSDLSICSDGNVTLQANLNASETVTNPVFYWYVSTVNGPEIIPNENNSTLNLTGLTPGNYAYLVGISSDEFCQTAIANLSPISFSILRNSIASDIVATNTVTCLGSPATLLPTTALENPAFSYFLSNDKTQPLTNDAIINGITYTINADGSITASGLTTENSPITIFIGLTSDATCLNTPGNFASATISLGNPPAPTTNAMTQNFCNANNPTVGDLQVNETNYLVYNVPIGGTALATTTPLVPGIYYITQLDGSCESDSRLVIIVTIGNPEIPTTNSASQTFCASENPTIADIQVNEENVIFYSTASGGTAIDPSTALASGNYFAAIVDGLCESETRLVIAVTVTSVGTPTTANDTQVFCGGNNPTVADIDVNETNILIFDVANGGNPLPIETPLQSGNYFVGLVDGNDCQSETRLQIAVSITDLATPTTNATSQTFCASENPTIADIQVNETGVIFYDAASGGNVLAPTTPLVSGNYFAVISDGTCESETRLEIVVSVTDLATPTTNSASQTFCASENPTTADIQVNETGIIFYDAASGGTILAPTTPLVSGNYFAVISDGNCESETRLEIAVSVTDLATPTTNAASQTFCASENPTIADIQVNETGVIFYDAASDGTILSPTTPLVSGNYFAVISDGNCESETRLKIAVSVTDLATPTTNAASQTFCASENPTVADIQVNEANVIFYDAASGGNVLAPTTPLQNGNYFAVISDGNCESETRLEIVVSVSDLASPTTNSASQTFCASENPTVADIQVNEANVIFYDAASGGTILAPTTPLISGNYFAVISDGNCESETRLEIAVSITDLATPTTNATSQTFCASENPTIADIQVNEANVIFYDAASGGTAIDPTTALVSGNYFAVISDGNCESETRLEIAVSVTDLATPTTNAASQTFCASENPTVADIQVNEANVIFYDAASGGNVLAPTTALQNGNYFAVISDGNCESETRLEIAVSVTDLATPTTNAASQTFCASENPTIADIQVNESGIIFYDAVSGGTILAPTTPLISGNYFAVISDGNCESETRLEIAVILTTNINAEIIGGSDSACISSTETYTTIAGMTDYLWDVTNGEIIDGGGLNENFVTVRWTTSGTGTINVSFDNVGGCTSESEASRIISVTTCSDITIVKTVNNPDAMVDETVVFTIVVQNTGATIFENVQISEQIPSGYQLLSSNASIGTFNPLSGLWSIPILNAQETATLTITVKVLATGEYLNTASIIGTTPEDSNPGNNTSEAEVTPNCLLVYNEFSPNNDGDNDLFRINCIENYPNNTLRVHNRYGVEVYLTKGYRNEWDGTANVNSPIDQDRKLPSGTYYYILELGDGSAAKTGWIYIIR